MSTISDFASMRNSLTGPLLSFLIICSMTLLCYITLIVRNIGNWLPGRDECMNSDVSTEGEHDTIGPTEMSM